MMPFDAAQQVELLDALKDFGAAHSSAAVPLANGKALELWLMLRIAQAAKLGRLWAVELCDGSGAPLPTGAPFKPRGQHGKIGASSSAGPGFIKLTGTKWDGTIVELELHDSLQWQGRSGALHECDVSVVAATVAQRLRGHRGGHPVGLPIAAVECKDKKSAGPIGDVREKLARMFDLTYLNLARPHNAWKQFDNSMHTGFGNRFANYLDAWRDGKFFIVREGYWQSGANKLANPYKIMLFDNIYAPGVVKNVVDEFVVGLNDVL